jgi:hypothetical protein
MYTVKKPMCTIEMYTHTHIDTFARAYLSHTHTHTYIHTDTDDTYIHAHLPRLRAHVLTNVNVERWSLYHQIFEAARVHVCQRMCACVCGYFELVDSRPHFEVDNMYMHERVHACVCA